MSKYKWSPKVSITIPHPNLLTSAINNMYEMITYYKLITWPRPLYQLHHQHITFTHPPQKIVNVEICISPPPHIALSFQSLIPTKLGSTKNGPTHVYHKTEDSINKNYNLRNNWALPVRENSPHISLQLYSDSTPKSQLTMMQFPKIIEATINCLLFDLQSWFLYFYNCTWQLQLWTELPV